VLTTRRAATTNPDVANTNSKGRLARGSVPANRPFRNRVTVLNAACITIAVMTLKRAMLMAQVMIRLTPIKTRL